MVRKSGLGRGLDALISSGESEGQATGILEIPVNQIKANPHQPRTHLEPQALQELATSIQEHGILQPLVLRHDPEGGYWLITGESPGSRIGNCPRRRSRGDS
jgi:ParB family chromosome partitioning protein